MSNTSTLVSCPCGKSFKDSWALRHHTRDSPRHLQQPVIHLPASVVIPVVPTVQDQQRDSSLLTANSPAVHTGGVKCPCGKLAKDEISLEDHMRFSSRHRQLAVVPVVLTVSDRQGESSLVTASIPAGHTGGVQCPCGKLVKNATGLKQHMRFSLHHRKLEVACIVDEENKASHQPPDEGVLRNCRRDSSSPQLVEENGLRHRPVTFIGAGVATGLGQGTGNKAGGKAKKKKKSKKTRQSYGVYSSGTETRRSYGMYSEGTGLYYSDVGDNHALCDKDCGWCGHCMDNVDIWWDD